MDENLPSADAAPRLVAVALGTPAVGSGSDLPRLLASGRGALAEQILSLAFEAGIRVRQDADLAQILTTLDLDTPIPPEAIVAVAEILNKVYEANNQLGSNATTAVASPPLIP